MQKTQDFAERYRAFTRQFRLAGAPELINGRGVYWYETPISDGNFVNERADRLIKNTGAIITFDGGDEAFTSTEDGSIHLPPKTHWATCSAYYGTVFHELGHWAGMNVAERQEFPMSFAEYVFGGGSNPVEEVAAESTAYFVICAIGISSEYNRNRSLSYIKRFAEAYPKDPPAKYVQFIKERVDFLLSFDR